MNGEESRAIDWPAVLARAHRRVAVRLALGAVVGAVGAVLLLGGGSATRGAIQEEDVPPPPPDITIPDPPGEPNLVLSAEASEAAEESEVGEGQFTVANESTTDAGEFTVVATVSSTGASNTATVPELAGGESTGGTFECPFGDSARVEIESSQPHGDAVDVVCAEGPEEPPEPPEPLEPPEPPELPEPPVEPFEEGKPSEEESTVD